MRLVAGGLLLLSLAACGQDLRTVFVKLPDPDARAMVVTIRIDTTPRFFAVEPVAGTAALDLEVDLVDDASVEALTYASTLETLGLEAGELFSGSGEETLPPEERVYSAEIRELAVGEWSVQPGRGADSDLLRVALKGSPCVRFGTERIELGGNAEDMSFVITLDDRLSIAGTRFKADQLGLYRISGSEVSSVTDFPSDLPYLTAAPALDGKTWFGGDGGRLYEGRVSLGSDGNVSIQASYVSTSSTGQPIASIAANGSGEELELYTLSAYGAFERFDGTGWTLLHHFHQEIGDSGTVIRTGPSHAYALVTPGSQVVEYLNGGIRDATPPSLSEPLHAMGYAPGVGLMAASGLEGTRLLGADNAWETLSGRPAIRQVFAIAPLDDGLLITGEFGATTQYFPGYGFCRLEVLENQSIGRISPTSDGFLLGSHARTSLRRPSITRLRRL